MTNKEITELLLNFLQSILTSVAFWVGVALIIFIFIFKNDISDFLKRLKQFKTKGFEVNTENESKKKEEETPKNEELAKEGEKTPEVPKAEEPKSLEEWRMEMIFAAVDKNQARADEAF